MQICWPSKGQWGKLWGRSRYVARALWMLGGIQTLFRVLIWLLDQKSRIEEAMLTVGQLGGVVGTLYCIVTSPWFGVGLIGVGVLYAIFVPAEEHPAEMHPAVGVRVANVFAWITVGVCAFLLWGALVAGYVAVQLPQHLKNTNIKELADIRETLSPRQLTELQQGQIAARLHPWPGHLIGSPI